MNLKKITIISIITIFIISFLSHNLYEWIPNTFTSIFFPVNESIWEHQKMAFTSIMIYGIIEYFLLKKVKHNNFILSLFVSSIITILLVISIFTPIYYLMDKKDNLFITLSIYLFSIIIGQIVAYYLLKSKKHYKTLNTVSLILIPIFFMIFGILTYNPIKNDLFYDNVKQKYGIYIYYE